jgi:hypothetical protein
VAGRLSEAFWHPTSTDHAQLSIEALLDRRDREWIESPTERPERGRAIRNKILTHDRVRLSDEEAFNRHWRRACGRIAESRKTIALLIGRREKGSVVRLYKAIEAQVRAKRFRIRFTDGMLELREGSMKTAMWMLREMTGLCFDTIRRALKRLKELLIISYSSTWAGTWITVLGFQKNQKSTPHVFIEEPSARRMALAIARELLSFQPDGKTKTRELAQKYKDWIAAWHRSGELPPQPQ